MSALARALHKEAAMKYLALPMLMLATGCGGASYTRVTTHAEAVEQPATGQSLLAAAPIEGDYRVRFTGGGQLGAGDTGSGQDGAALQTASLSAAGSLALRAGPVEIAGVADVPLERANGAPDTDGARRYGFRIRTSPGRGDWHLGLSFDGGARQINIARGASVSCEVEPSSDGWRQLRGDDQCWANNRDAGTTETYWKPYFATTIYPTLQLAEGVYLYGGLAFDSAAVGYTETEVLAHYESGRTNVEESDRDLDYTLTMQAVAGLDIHLFDAVGLLATVRSQSLVGDVDLPGPVFEGALSMRF